MKHRHLRDGVGYALPAIDSILEFGDDEDLAALRAEVERDPFGTVADGVLKIARAHRMEGISDEWIFFVEQLRKLLD